MDLKNFTCSLNAIILSFLVVGFFLMFLGAAGYSRMGWTGVGIAAVPALVIGIGVFFVLNWVFRELSK